jgi:hypothetical protein
VNPETVKVGMKVRFHPIIGGKHDGNVYTVERLGSLHGEPVAWLKEMLCCAAVSSLSQYVSLSCPALEIAQRMAQDLREYADAADECGEPTDITRELLNEFDQLHARWDDKLECLEGDGTAGGEE